MATIANLNQNEDGSFEGHIKTPLLNFPIKIDPISEDKTNDNQPDYRVYVNNFECGAGWSKTAKSSGKNYISVSIDDPVLPSAINAKLNDIDGEFKLIWSR